MQRSKFAACLLSVCDRGIDGACVTLLLSDLRRQKHLPFFALIPAPAFSRHCETATEPWQAAKCSGVSRLSKQWYEETRDQLHNIKL